MTIFSSIHPTRHHLPSNPYYQELKSKFHQSFVFPDLSSKFGMDRWIQCITKCQLSAYNSLFGEDHRKELEEATIAVMYNNLRDYKDKKLLQYPT